MADQRTQPIVTRYLARTLWSSTAQTTLAGVVAFQRRAYSRATMLVRAYYAVAVFLVVQSLGSWPTYADKPQASPLWPASWWFDRVSVRTGVNVIFAVLLVASVVALMLPDRRLARAAYSVALLEYMALVNGFDKINHSLHAWLFVSVIFIFLPRGPWDRRTRASDRQYFLTIFWVAQLVVLFMYTLTGYWKIYFSFKALFDGKIGGFSFGGFSYIVAKRLLQANVPTVLGDFFVHHELIGWALFIGTMYLEFASVLIAFRPRLHRIWGLGLITFHVATQLAMGFTFLQNLILVGLLLVCSPFAPERVGVKDAVQDLPGIHLLVRWRERRVRRIMAAPSPPEDISTPAGTP